MNLDVTLDTRQLVDSFLGGQYVERWPEADFLALHSGREVSLRCPSSCARCLPAAAFALPVRCPACSLPTALHTTARCALHSRALSCTDRARRSFPQVYYVDVLEGDYFFLNLACCMPHARRHARRRHARSLIVCFLGCS